MLKCCNTIFHKKNLVDYTALILKIMRYLLAKIKNKNQCSIINKYMYEKLCYKRSILKNDKLNSNINISKI